MFVAMPAESARFHESNLWATPIRDFGLTIEGTPLQPIIEEFEEELRRVGLTRIHPRFYLSTEWGVPFETVAIGIPFYLARPDLTALHAERTGHVEGFGRADILRYLRHEMGHVVNYAYRLYEQRGVGQAVRLDHPAVPRRSTGPSRSAGASCATCPGWYAQKHPDEDWAETFAVWMTPGCDWRAEYAGWPAALAKLEYCDRTHGGAARPRPAGHRRRARRGRRATSSYSLDQYYRDEAIGLGEVPAGSRRRAARDLRGPRPCRRRAGASRSRPRPSADPPAGAAISWPTSSAGPATSPSAPGCCCRHLAERAEQLRQVYLPDREAAATVALTTLVTALAMNHVQRGSYLP